ncbi:MAG: diguanylate cyclase domain-containing protein, partial [Actinomycetota bacterium]
MQATARHRADSPRAADAERLIEAERGVVSVRWFGIGVALFQILASAWAAGTRLTPVYLLPAALGLVAFLAAFNLFLSRWLRQRAAGVPVALLIRAGVLAVVIDHTCLIALVWLYSYQPNAAIWTLLLVLPMEGAARYETPGALLSIGVVGASEVARQVIRYPSTIGAAAVASVTLRLGILTLIGLLTGVMTQNRNRERQEVERRARLLEVLAHEKAELALHDPLTGLPNRELFRQRVEAAVAAAAEAGIRCAVMLMDLDRFKEINDTLGHHNGDRVLTVLADRLAGKMGESSTVARLGGDEFGLLSVTVGDPPGAVAAGRDILELLEEPVAIDGLALHIEASIGIAVYP